ncbi:MAG: efflux RND transporter periplasmic adaptor subunit [Anaerolineae bacterium]|nr:efflux RND transporter periplasmic adaptor subunit [Anaerolineae bacterium]
MKKKLIWIIAIVLIVAAVGGYIWFRNRQQQDASGEVLRTAEVIRGDLDITVAASGNVVANQKAELRFAAPGIVETIAVDVGERVETGQILASIESERLALALSEAQTRLDRATVELERQLQEANLGVQAAEIRIIQAELRAPSAASGAAAVRAAEASLDRVTAGASPEDIAIAERQVEQTKNALWAAQVQRDQACSGNPSRDPGLGDLLGGTQSCDAAQAGVQQAEESVLIAQLQLQKVRNGPANADIAAAQAQVDQARAEYGRLADEVEAQDEGMELLTIDLERSKLVLERLKDGVDPLLALAVETAQDDLDRASLKAPFDGVIAAVNLQTGVQVNSALPAVTLVDNTKFFVDVTIDETDIGKIQAGHPVEITLDAYPRTTLPGTVERIGPAPAPGISGVVAYPVRIQIDSDEGIDVRDGMTASVLITTSRLEDVLLVPNWAVRTDQTSQQTFTYCYCMTGETLRQVQVAIGERNEIFTQIISGLEEGATVALVTEERNLFELTGPPSGRP